MARTFVIIHAIFWCSALCSAEHKQPIELSSIKSVITVKSQEKPPLHMPAKRSQSAERKALIKTDALSSKVSTIVPEVKELALEKYLEEKLSVIKMPRSTREHYQTFCRLQESIFVTSNEDPVIAKAMERLTVTFLQIPIHSRPCTLLNLAKRFSIESHTNQDLTKALAEAKNNRSNLVDLLRIIERLTNPKKNRLRPRASQIFRETLEKAGLKNVGDLIIKIS